MKELLLLLLYVVCNVYSEYLHIYIRQYVTGTMAHFLRSTISYHDNQYKQVRCDQGLNLGFVFLASGLKNVRKSDKSWEPENLKI